MPKINNNDQFDHWASSPCKGCEYRVLGCHDICGPYSSYKEEVARNRKIVRDERTSKTLIFDRHPVLCADGRKRYKKKSI